MIPETIGLGTRAEELRQAFDQSFARAPTPERESLDDYLAFQVGEQSFILAMADIARLLPIGRLLLLPGSPPAFLGFTGLRGKTLPVYDLPALLGYPGRTTPRWMVEIEGPTPVLLGFDRFEGQFRMPPGGSPVEARTVVDLNQLRGTISRIARDHAPLKEA